MYGIPPTKNRKLETKTIDCVFIGCAQHSVTYRFLVLKSEVNWIDANTIIKSRDATFLEDVFHERKLFNT